MESSNEEKQLIDIRRDIDLLRNAVQELGKPWYRQALTLITGISLLVSILSASFTYISKYTEDMRSKREELRKILTGIVDLSYAHAFNRRNSAADVKKRNIYIEVAESLVEQLPDKVTSQEYLVLADVMFMTGNIKKAEYYGEMAIKYSSNILSKSYALNDLASFYFSIKDFEKGRRHYQKSAELLSDAKEDFIIHDLGNTYHLWGIEELENGFEQNGIYIIEKARKHYSDLPVSRRTDALKYLETAVNEALARKTSKVPDIDNNINQNKKPKTKSRKAE